MNDLKNITIIGGGVSGLILGSYLAKRGVSCTILEGNDRIGQKILQTGNGKCNFFNYKLESNKYNHPEFIDNLKTIQSIDNTLNDLDFLGLTYTVSEENRMYPASFKASSFLDFLRYNLNNENVEVITSCYVKDIKKDNDIYLIDTSKGIIKSKYVVLSTGSYVETKDVKCNTFNILDRLNIKYTNTHPGLVGIKVGEDLSIISGLRINSNVSLYNNDELLYSEFGEVQVKKDGFSGIPVMNAANRFDKDNLKLVFDFDPFHDLTQIKGIIGNSMMSFIDQTLPESLCTYIPKELTMYLLKKLNIKPSLSNKDVKFKHIDDLSELIKHVEFNNTSLYGYDNAHITCGGICLDEINNNFESKKYPNMYFVGEILDINGNCGGYNMGFAISSALVAAKSLIKCCK